MGRLRPLIILLPALLLACGDQGPSTPVAIVVAPNVPRVPMGGTLQLDVAVVNADGRAIEGEPVTFESAEPDVVRVSDAGLLTAVGSLDTVAVTARSGELETEVAALVVPPPSSLVVVPLSLRLAAGEDFQLYIVATDEHGDSLPDAGLVFESDFPEVAWLDTYGVVRTVGSGLATVSIIRGEQRMDIPVTVTSR